MRVHACHDCDLVQELPVDSRSSWRCVRCRARLSSAPRRGVSVTLALTLTALVLFLVANRFPFVTFELGERTRQVTLLGAVRQLWTTQHSILATVVLLTSIVAPLLKLLGLLYVTLPLLRGGVPPRIGRSWRFLLWVRPWGMLEVYLLACFVSFVKLTQIATLDAAFGFYAFVGLLLTETLASLSFDPRWIWHKASAKDHA